MFHVVTANFQEALCSELFLFWVGTKTLVVHGQNECDIPTQLPVHEDTQFEALLKVRKSF